MSLQEIIQEVIAFLDILFEDFDTQSFHINFPLYFLSFHNLGTT